MREHSRRSLPHIHLILLTRFVRLIDTLTLILPVLDVCIFPSCPTAFTYKPIAPHPVLPLLVSSPEYRLFKRTNVPLARLFC